MNRNVNRPLLKRLIKKMGRRATGRLAEKANVGQSTIEKLMAGTYASTPKEITRQSLCEALEVPEDQLFPLAPTRGRAS